MNRCGRLWKKVRSVFVGGDGQEGWWGQRSGVESRFLANQSENGKEQITQVERRVAAEALQRPRPHSPHSVSRGALISLHSAPHKARIKGRVRNLNRCVNVTVWSQTGLQCLFYTSGTGWNSFHVWVSQVHQSLSRLYRWVMKNEVMRENSRLGSSLCWNQKHLLMLLPCERLFDFVHWLLSPPVK